VLSRAAVVVPAYNEQTLLGNCLAAIGAATGAVDIPVELIVVADACTDATESIARSAGATLVRSHARSVGVARAAGCAQALRRGPGGLMLAHTDADTLVPPHWLGRLVDYLQTDADLVAGTVTVADWSVWPAELPAAYDARYQRTGGHVHGANLAMTASAYLTSGGFSPRRSGEDQELVNEAERTGLRVRYASDLTVICSARRHARAPHGFSGHLHRLEADLR
jgi:glycosyltransferase involved in cell wall biosynthesis